MDQNITNSAEGREIYTTLMERIKELENTNYVLAHDLRGAAANMAMLSDMLRERQAEFKDEPSDARNGFTTSEIIDCIGQCSAAMVSTLSGAMDVVNRKLNEQAKCDECDVEQIVENVTSKLNGTIKRNGVKIMLHLAKKHIKCAKNYLESIVYNMVSNAIKYARPGVPLELEICSYSADGRPILEFKDNGLGINLTKHGSKIFGLNETFHSKEESMGVGLFITKDQVEALGGRIQVQSEENVGTEFRVLL